MTEPTEPFDAASPCVRLCRLDRPGGVCLGCGRTLDEIAAWSGLDPAERRALMRRLPKRLAGLSRGGEA